MVVNPLLMGKLEAEVALNPLSGGVALPLVVGQTCFCQSLEEASKVVTVQSILCSDETLFSKSLLLVFDTLFFLLACCEAPPCV
jgi:hypothetical protein